MNKWIAGSFFSLISVVATAQKPMNIGIMYPHAKMTDQQDDYFGTTVSDPYRWLENDTSIPTRMWVKEENILTQRYFAQIPFRDSIKQRLTELWNYEKYTAPFKEGDYTYYSKNDGLQNQYVVYRQKGNEQPEVFLDPNTFSADGTSSLGGLDFTKDGSLAAYQVSEGGSDWRKVYVMDAQTKQKTADFLQDVKFSSIAWYKNEGFYYSSYDKPVEGSALSGKTQYHKLYYHKLGTPQASDKLVFGGEATPRRYIGADVTEDQRYLIISAANATYGNELYIQDLSQPAGPIVPIITGFNNEQQLVYEENGKLYLATNLNAPNRRLIVTDATNPKPENWRDLIPEAAFPLTVTSCGGKFFAQYLKDAVSKVSVYNLDGKKEGDIELPGLGTAGGFSGKREEKEAYYTFTSYMYPPTIFRYDIGSAKSSVYKKPTVKFDPNMYESKQVFYLSADSTKVPMIITYKKGLKLNNQAPAMLYAYGGFNVSITPSFSISNLVFMENGGVYAVPNIRGGGEYGDKWHNAGTKMQKQNVFNDFYAAAGYLLTNGYASPERLAASGASNGGLLIGAAITQQPGLFRVCFPTVGVLDMLRYNKFTAGAGWSYDYGTAEDSKEMFEYLYAYSPVHNVRHNICYPATLITTGDHDDRVVPAHSFKFAAALQAAQMPHCGKPILINIETRAGHGAGKPTDMVIQEQADKWAFMLYNMDLPYNPKAVTAAPQKTTPVGKPATPKKKPATPVKKVIPANKKTSK
ncbi:MAG: S9 family peptidase [Bacteroidetes bacterium]|nr:S9 family peptidase [Bacteroidota bacterium]